MNSRELVRSYFDRASSRFDAIYEERKPLHQQLVDRWFRRVVVERFRLITALAPQAQAWTVLDVGCGPGRYALALAQAGAASVVGVDVSEEMIKLARAQAEKHGIAGKCSFTVAPFLEFATSESFDVVVATGYFDYIEEPLADLRKMVEHCRGRIFASFPKRFEFRVPIRKLRFALAGGFVRFYAQREIEQLFESAGVSEDRFALVDLGRDYLAVARAR
jgi:2-polyprenyl-3-methyl-5-hydroxy-6-metoxy-1,4-benzoquinol methylase